MAKLPLVYYGTSGLRETAQAVDTFNSDLSALGADMVETMRHERGIGLAGPQIGKRLRIFAMQIPEEMDLDETGERLNPELPSPLVVVNPSFSEPSPNVDDYEEGCLSIPGVTGYVKRPVSITMQYQDTEGNAHSIRLHGLAARCAQHEVDHLDGKLFIDYLSHVKKMSIRSKLKRIKEDHA